MNNIKQKYFFKVFFTLSILFISFINSSAQETAEVTPTVKTGKAPIIIVPGLTGSELVNKKTGDVVWFQKSRAKDDDIRLPISPVLTRNRDSLVVKDIIRNIKFLKFLPEVEIYDKLLVSLEKRGGYQEGKWDAPPKDGYQDTFYVFAYDWRRDNVENARLLMRKVNALKTKLRKPNLKFNVVAHSMGGLITRYAAMYGDSDLPRGKASPTWAGSRNFDRVFLLGTPNEGSVTSLQAVLNGFSYIGGGLNLPFVQDVSKFDVFTIPSIYQLLPHNGTFNVYDENLQPLKIDLLDPKVWDTYDWNIINDENFKKHFSAAEVKSAKAYFVNVLARAKKFHEALDANTRQSIPVSFYLLGGDCKETPDSAIVYRDKKKNKWKTQFNGGSFERENGEKVSSEEIKKIIYTMGDGVVSKRSLAGETFVKNGRKAFLPVTSEIYLCEGHTKLITSANAQDKLFALLFGEAVEQTTAENKK
ncbi:hypothetical protein BH20ACI4_BH20ACI4_34130 [soil metagenome]